MIILSIYHLWLLLKPFMIVIARYKARYWENSWWNNAPTWISAKKITIRKRIKGVDGMQHTDGLYPECRVPATPISQEGNSTLCPHWWVGLYVSGWEGVRQPGESHQLDDRIPWVDYIIRPRASNIVISIRPDHKHRARVLWAGDSISKSYRVLFSQEKKK